MAQPSTRNEFKQYCLRELGHPVIEINVDDEQLDDRIDDALQQFHIYHFEGSERMYLTKSVTQQDRQNKYVTIDPKVLDVLRIFPFHTSQVSDNIFSVRYQIALNDFHDISSIDLSYYDMTMRQINLLDEMLVGTPSIRFNKHTNRIYVDADWLERFAVGDLLLFEAYVKLDPSEYGDAWNNEFLKKLAIQYIKKQWGTNLKKFKGVQLPGGIELDGETIYNEAVDEIQRLEEQLETKYSEPFGIYTR